MALPVHALRLRPRLRVSRCSGSPTFRQKLSVTSLYLISLPLVSLYLINLYLMSLYWLQPGSELIPINSVSLLAWPRWQTKPKEESNLANSSVWLFYITLIPLLTFLSNYIKQMCFCCSAGAGRTGTFIALSNILERVKAEGLLDVFQAVKSLRLQRPHMVQTLVWYLTIQLFVEGCMFVNILVGGEERGFLAGWNKSFMMAVCVQGIIRNLGFTGFSCYGISKNAAWLNIPCLLGTGDS